MNQLKAVILAAGKGTRMKSDLPKVVHTVNGKPMVEYAIDAAKGAGADKVCLVVGYKSEVVKEMVTSNVEYVLQEEQLGTGHAVKCAKDFIGEQGEILVLFGDTPLITGKTLGKLVEFHRTQQNKVTVLSAKVEDPTGYGRIIRSKDNSFLKSVEHKDASEEELLSKEVNSGMYVFDAKELSIALDALTTNNAQGEYYLPDTLTIIKNKGFKVDAYVLEDAKEMTGVNDQEQLKEVERMIRER
ncbi:sugar phosphate nucleotidyltransferase [Candidatus Galacturonibacter soehngenii]|uniref:NTP transferase domain-containing protein n=1 Tax=Candidatus Galacturonatibacter soehngenii TaxID=2307010 RepID=A0A7V7QII5_9FIRM|nr:sugar phosphate nucleotidyltransferase [Candidatus Galacturonibacter soehngenii]KAB1435894.1 NTP transferase domain-containing protein [Candidatus Galacturonibacter soehngenii]MBA4686639.1 NTP transferase domain-containing protein [Candidatus Galacturonibacter soehngenii]